MANNIEVISNGARGMVKINNYDMSIKEYHGARVVTFKDIDTVHGRATGTARKRFNDNKGRFIEGVDYYVVDQPSEIRTLGITRPQGGTPQIVTLVAESGYLMLVKSFNDDLAWEVQRQLVNSYFKGKKSANDYQQLLLEINELKSNLQDVMETLLVIPQFTETANKFFMYIQSGKEKKYADCEVLNVAANQSDNCDESSIKFTINESSKKFTIKDGVEDIINYMADYFHDNTSTKLRTRKTLYALVTTDRGWKLTQSKNHCKSKAKLLANNKMLKTRFVKACNNILEKESCG